MTSVFLTYFTCLIISRSVWVAEKVFSLLWLSDEPWRKVVMRYLVCGQNVNCVAGRVDVSQMPASVFYHTSFLLVTVACVIFLL